MADTYDVVINTPKHHRVGKLALTLQGDTAVAHLDITDEGYADGEGTRAGKEFDVSGVAHVGADEEVTFSVHGSTWANSIEIKGDSSLGEIMIYGTSTGLSAGDYLGNDPGFAGRWADVQ